MYLQLNNLFMNISELFLPMTISHLFTFDRTAKIPLIYYNSAGD
jgi:hypothetical protein